MITMNENGRLDNTNTSVINIFHTVGPPLAHPPKTRKQFLGFLEVHTREKQYSLLCIICTPMPQIIPLTTLMLVCTWHQESTPKELDQ